MTVKDEMRMLIDVLPDDAASDALDYMRWLAQEFDTLTDADLVEVRLGEAEIASGETVTLSEFRCSVVCRTPMRHIHVDSVTAGS